MKKTEIIPAILPKDFTELQEKIELVRDYVKTVQIDVCDGQFTPQATWPYRKEDDSFDKIVREEEGLPGWEKLNIEIDLMVNRPEEHVEEWVSAGATRVIIHAESRGDVAGAIEALSGRIEVGLALGMETPVSAIKDLESKIQEGKIQSIQLMGIDNIGFQHQPFDEKVIDRIKEVHAAYPDLIISIDGGVSLENGTKLVEAGVTRLVVGSAIFNSNNYLDTLAEFKKLGH